VIDTETTGLNEKKDKIIEIGAVELENGVMGRTFSALVDPGCPIPAQITKLTRINDGMVKGQPLIGEAMEGLLAFIGDAVLLAHNAAFDRGFLRAAAKIPNQWLDTMDLARIVRPCAASFSLQSLTGDNPHRALGDALSAAGLFLELCREFEGFDEAIHESILALAGESKDALSSLLTRLSSAALNKFGRAKKSGRPAVYAPKAYPTIPARDASAAREDYQIPLSDIQAYLGKGGKAEKLLPGFEERPAQIEMASLVAESLNGESNLLLEAGTGTGKSLAYLLPAALFAVFRGETVTVSTHTITLQEQLINKDIPLLRRLLGREVSAVVSKGRANYLCLRCWRGALREPRGEDVHFLMALAVWLAQTADGDGGKTAFLAHEKDKWLSFCASKENCTAPNCAFSRSECFVFRNRKAAAEADILILNHSLLLADAASQKDFLPRTPSLIIDEAHHLEKVAEEQLSARLDYYELVFALARLQRKGEGGRGPAGILDRLTREAETRLKGAEERALFEQNMFETENALNRCYSCADVFFSSLRAAFIREALKEGFYPAKIRLLQKTREMPFWPELAGQARELAKALTDLEKAVFSLLEDMEEDEENGGGVSGRDELRNSALNCRSLAQVLSACLELEQRLENHVAWVEFKDAEKRPSLHMAPVELGRLLQKCLYEQKKTIIMTSATLTANNSFRHFKKAVGLDLLPEPPAQAVLPSPFYYQEQALLAICDDLPNPAAAGEIEFAGEAAALLKEMITALQGRSLVLFTSHHQLKAVWQEISAPLEEAGITVLAQGISGGRNSILQRFRQEPRACILGANTFWEGIDVVGEKLSLVVMVKLPFSHPNTPTLAARAEKIAERGGNSFEEYTLPQAIIAFKQGFGRLIRSGEDMGVFCLLDRRIFEKSYGRQFISSLPQMRVVKGKKETVIRSMSDWLDV